MNPSTSAGVESVGAVLPAYEPRQIRFRELLSIEGWILKLYGISLHGAAVSPALASAVVNVATAALPTAPHTDTRYGVGFVIAHESVTTSYVLFCWWDERNELHQRVFSAPAVDPSQLKPHNSLAIGCVWELSVSDFERRAWIEHVLKPGGSPNLQDYLAQELNEDV